MSEKSEREKEARQAARALARWKGLQAAVTGQRCGGGIRIDRRPPYRRK